MKKKILLILLIIILSISGVNALFSNNASLSTNNGQYDSLNNTLIDDDIDMKNIISEKTVWDDISQSNFNGQISLSNFNHDYLKEQPHFEFITDNLIRVTVGNMWADVEYEPYLPSEITRPLSVEDEYGPNYDDCYVRCHACHGFVPIGNTVVNSLPDGIICQHFHGSLNPLDYNFNQIFKEKSVQYQLKSYNGEDCNEKHEFKFYNITPVDNNNPDALHGRVVINGEPMDVVVDKAIYDDDPDCPYSPDLPHDVYRIGTNEVADLETGNMTE